MNKAWKWLKDLYAEEAGSAAVLADAQDTGSSAYSADKPIERIKEDRFNRWPFAKRIAETLATRSDPASIVVGVYGVWGDGKTSVLNLMKIALKEHQNVIPVHFNPWYFGSQEQLLRGFFKTLAEAAGKSLTQKKEAIGEYLTKYGSLLSLASVSLSGGLLQVGSGGDIATGLGAALSNVELDELRDRLEKILEDSNKRIVVMIDDIDRLDQEEIHAVFKLVKLSAGFKHISYVLALDDAMVSAALGKKYGDGDATAGRNFLEKIVQVPLHLPNADEIELRRMTFEGVDEALKLSGMELPQEQVDAFVRHFIDGIEPRLKTPRQSKLYANALAFALPILKGEVNPVDQMLIEGIRIFYPALYGVIRDNPDEFLRESRYQRENPKRDSLIETALKEAGAEDIKRVKERLLEALFPRIGNASYGGDWDRKWAEEQRIASADYFKRYFMYSVPLGDMPDIETSSFVQEITEKSDAELDALFAEVGRKRGMAQLIKKLRDKMGTIPSPAAIPLAMAVARNGQLIPRERDLVSDWSLTQAAILISELVKKLPEETPREEAARKLIQAAQPLAFAFECWKWLRKSDGRPEEDRIIPVETETELGRLLADRIKVEAAKAPLYKTFGGDAPRLFWAWNHDGVHEEVEKYLTESFDSAPTNVTDFLATFLGTAWLIESGLPKRSDLERDNYDAIAKLVSPEVIMGKLKALYGSKLDDPQFYQSDSVSVADQVAYQFAYVHNKVLEERKKKEEAASKTEPSEGLEPST